MGGFQSLIPVVMSGIIAVYALVVAVLIAGDMNPPPNGNYTLFMGFMHLACGLSVGLTGLAAGYAIGVVGDMVRPSILNMVLKANRPRVSALTCSNPGYSLAWSSSSFSERCWVYTGMTTAESIQEFANLYTD